MCSAKHSHISLSTVLIVMKALEADENSHSHPASFLRLDRWISLFGAKFIYSRPVQTGFRLSRWSYIVARPGADLRLVPPIASQP